MRTDISFAVAAHHGVIETKCTGSPLESSRGGAPKLRSAHLYQTMSYLTQLEGAGQPGATGVLLYAVDRDPIRVDLRVRGHDLRIRSIDLSTPWPEIHGDLLALASELATAAADARAATDLEPRATP
jgi:hypothetical protein